MLIIYKGYPVMSRTGKGRAAVWVDDQGVHDLPQLIGDSGLDWGCDKYPGDKLIPRIGNAALALALCAGVVDEPQARRVYMRFRMHHIDKLPVNEPWLFTEKQIADWIAEIEAVGAEAQQAIARAPQERLFVERDVGLGANGVPVVWDTDDQGRQIVPKDPDDFAWTPAPYRRPGT